MDSLLISVFLPLAINMGAGICVVLLTNRNKAWIWIVFVASVIVTCYVTWQTWSQIPRTIVVPDFTNKYADPAGDFGRSLGLRPELTYEKYGPCGGRVVRQSLPPSSEVHLGTPIKLSISLGSPVGYGMGMSADHCP